MSLSHAAAAAVLRHYPFADGPTVPVGNAGGFSGARLWRVGELCLRAWPEGGPTPQRLTWIHRLMDTARAAGLEFVPTVLRTRDGATFVESAGRLWELTTWMPGRADFRERPTDARLAAACTALARLHLAWSSFALTLGPCPAVARRIDTARAWDALLASGWEPSFMQGGDDPVAAVAESAWRLLRRGAASVVERLAPWSALSVPLQPCLCDVWHDHVLFEGDVVRGLIDYGAARTDHVAVDLARLLGSLVGGDRKQLVDGLDAYRRVRPLSGDEERLVIVLDEAGVVLAAANWLRWLYHDGRRFEGRAAVAARFAAVVEQLEEKGGFIIAE